MKMKKMKDLLSNKILDNNKVNFIRKQKNFIIVATAVIVLSIVCGLGASTITNSMLNKSLVDGDTNYSRTADPNTMEDYYTDDKGVKLDQNSRNAGRIWSDKTVFANGKTSGASYDGTDLTLNNDLDGTDSKIKNNTDFLHVFSTIGSSQVVDQYTPQPLDVVLLLDISSSMTELTAGQMNPNDSLHQVIGEANSLIKQLMGADPEHTVNPGNRVGVIVYGGGDQVLLPLGHYTSSAITGSYMAITDKTNKSGNTAYFPRITRTVNGLDALTTRVMEADATYLQGALYEGMKMLAEEDDTTYRNKATGRLENRTPILITLTDGATNIVSATETNMEPNESYDWWDPYTGVIDPVSGGQYAAPGTNPIYANCNSGTGNEDRQTEIEAISTRTVSNLLLASYYKNKVESNYGTDMKNYSIGYNIQGLGAFPNEQLLATLNPEEYFKEDREFSGFSANNETKAKDERTKAHETIQSYIAKAEPKLDFPRDGKTYDWASASSTASFTYRHPGDEDNDLKEFADVYYIDQYYEATSGDISDIFDSIWGEIAGTKFNPIEGINDAGTKDSLIYMDTIGEYMEIKDKGIALNGTPYDMAMVLFEKPYGLVKSAIYDYKFNVEHRNAENNLHPGTFQEGWYDKDGNLIGYYSKDEAGNNGALAWGRNGSFDDGDTYYLSIDTVRQYVSTLSEDENSLTEQEKNTVYTIYRIDDNSRNDSVLNPCYEKISNVNYKLSDIRVWVEETGDFEDEQSGGAINLGYDAALYVNLPKEALPILTANISIDTQDNITYVTDKDFKANLTDAKSSHVTPFRLFYGVGVQDSVKSEDGLDIDISKLSKEYIESHTVNDQTESGIYFLSNYFSNTPYEYVFDAKGEETDIVSRGDPNTTFSPSALNRYYAFQKPLILYKTTNDGITEYTEKALSDSEYTDFINNHQNSMITDGQVESNDWYWVILDYYTSDGKEAHVAVTRKGSEFGSAFGDEIDYGEYLVWYNIADNDKVAEENVRGFNRYGQSQPNEEGTWVIATKIGGLRTGNLAQKVCQKSNNVTKSSNTYYVPTISNNTDTNNIIVDNYLGNNGRIIIPNKLLQVTKEVEDIKGSTTNPNKEFTFEAKINNYVGDHSAIVLVKNPYSGEWQLRVNSINIVTDNKGLLQKSDSSNQSTYTVKHNGVDCYVYVGGSATNDSDENDYPLYRVNSETGLPEELEGVGRTSYVSRTDLENLESTYNARYARANLNHPVGSTEFWVDKAYYVPKAEADVEGWTFEAGKYEEINQFVIAELDSNKSGISQLTSDYVTKSEYLTKTLYFGYAKGSIPDPRPEGISNDDWNWMTNPDNEYKARFTLKDGEGLEFVGIGEDEDYTVTEILSKEELDDGYTFDKVVDDEGNTRADVQKDDGTYTVSGVVDERREEHYFNTYRVNYDLKLSKTIMGSLAEEDEPDKVWTFRIKLTPEEIDGFKKEYTYQKCTKIDDNSTCEDMEEKLTFELKTDEDGNQYYEAIIKLKAGDIYNIKNIDYLTKYDVVEDEANQNGYDSSYKTEDGYDSESGDMTDDRNVGIINAKWAPGDLTIRKTVKGSLGDTNKNWTFKVTLMPVDGYVVKDSYNYAKSTGEKGTVSFAKNEDGTYSTEVTLKHGQYITIQGLPEGISYKVEEKEANTDDYVSTVADNNAEGNIDKDQNVDVGFINAKYDSRSLTVGKRVEGSLGDKDKTWNFDIILIPEDGVWTEDSYTLDYVGSHITDDANSPIDGKITFTRGSDKESYRGSVQLKHGQTITIEGIPEGTQYKVVEQEANDSGYKTSVPDNSSGMLTDQSENVIFVNTLNGTVDLEIEKQVAFGDNAKEWTFDVYLTPPTGVTLEDSYSYTGSTSGDITFKDNGDGSYKGSLKLKHDQTVKIEGLPEGTRYQVVEEEANKEGYITGRTNNATGNLEYQNTPHVTFTNTHLEPGTLNISKEVLGENGDYNRAWTFKITLSNTGKTEPNLTYNYTGGSIIDGIAKPTDGEITFARQTDESYVGEVTIKHGQYITIKDLPDNTHYKVEELDNDKYFVTHNAIEGDINSGDNIGYLVTYNNNLPGLKDLTLSKLVHGVVGLEDVAKGKMFNFKLTFTPLEGVRLEDSYHFDGTKEGDIKLTYNDDEGTYTGTVSLTHEDQITIHGLPENTKYEILETDADDYDTIIDGSTPGRLTDDTSVVFHNIRLSNFDLSIKKNVKGNLGDKNKFWTFTVILTFPSTFDVAKELDNINKYTVNGKDYDLNLKENAVGNYVGKFSIKHGQTAIIKNLPENTKYVVEEVEANKDGYMTKTTENTDGTIDKNGILVEYDNWKFSTHRLVIEKHLKGDAVETDRFWTFEISFIPEEKFIFNNSYPYIKNNGEEGLLYLTENSDGSYKGTVKIKGGESITIDDIPYNTKYVVKEIEANQDNYKTTSKNSVGTLTKKEHRVVYTNTRNDANHGMVNPKTGDDIFSSMGMLVISSIMMIILAIRFRKKLNLTK